MLLRFRPLFRFSKRTATVHRRATMNADVRQEGIFEIVLPVAVYAGVPTRMNAVTAAKKALVVCSSSLVVRKGGNRSFAA